ncbi:MAP9 protein, partial [Neodrepanis coruscans]|nr:MAP9 protein [Neodrepanis coruscans]
SGIEEELTASNSGAASTGKSSAVENPLFTDDASHKTANLKNEAPDDLTLSFHEKKLQQIMVLEGENIQDDRKDVEEECLEGQNEGNDVKDNEELSAVKEVLCDNNGSDDLPIHELRKKRNQEKSQRIGKLQMHRQRNASASGEKKALEFLRRKYTGNTLHYIKFNNNSHGQIFFCTEIKMSRNNEILVNVSSQSFFLPLDQDEKTVTTSDLKPEDNGRKSPPVIEQMMTTVSEKTNELENPTADSSDGILKTAEGQITTGTMRELSVNDQSENEEAKNVSKNSVKVLLIHTLPLFIGMSPSSVHLKKKVKAVPPAAPVSSQYLGTLKVLEDKCMQKKRTEFDKADSLRAAVFQNWLEKKNLLLMELKRAEKEKAENLRNSTEKKEALKREESIASFEAWKKKKAREAKKLSEKKKLEELVEKKAEQNKEKTEAAQVAFKKWKERKVKYLREQRRKEKQSERIRKKKEEELVAEKRRISISAVEKWNKKKEEYIKKKEVEKFLERKNQEMQQAKKEEKNEKALEEYERWLENKERREQLEKRQKKWQAVHGNEMSSPWRPPGKVTYSGNY